MSREVSEIVRFTGLSPQSDAHEKLPRVFNNIASRWHLVTKALGLPLNANSLPFLVVRWLERHDGLLKSAATEQQLLEVLARPYIAAATIPALREGITRMLAAAELVPITESITACRDPTDDKLLELAVNGRADLIVSGDGDLLALNPFRDIPIVTPAAFVQGLAR
jgi:uncharacterized protein